jgi:threonine/homoserine/homoserine lactone efflux protein
MMMLFWTGVVIGVSVAAPVGAIGVLCMVRTLTYGRRIGFVSGLGAATADAVYGCIAGFGLTAIAQFLITHQQWFSFGGGLFLGYLGWQAWLSPPPIIPGISTHSSPPITPPAVALSPLKAYRSTFVLTLTNPATILSFIGIFSGLGLVQNQSTYGSALLLVGGVFSGSMAWWWVLSWVVNRSNFLRQPQRMRWINRGSGVILITMGLGAIASVFVPS